MSPFLPMCHLPSSVRQRIGNEPIAEAVIGAAVEGGAAGDDRVLVGWAAAEEWTEL